LSTFRPLCKNARILVAPEEILRQRDTAAPGEVVAHRLRIPIDPVNMGDQNHARAFALVRYGDIGIKAAVLGCYFDLLAHNVVFPRFGRNVPPQLPNKIGALMEPNPSKRIALLS
jgi:hypothetical protein